jgi:hypothetical protein
MIRAQTLRVIAPDQLFPIKARQRRDASFRSEVMGLTRT